ncbi:MAG TPA: hypothetical protein VE593_04700 [Nitrososphaeraceae archaeon]|nr:hypothetical protein [Nitrososphaeraceae archaeon]
MISRTLFILVVISSLPLVSFLQLPPKVMAQIPPKRCLEDRQAMQSVGCRGGYKQTNIHTSQV